MQEPSKEIALADAGSQRIEILAAGDIGYRDVVPGRIELDFNDEDESPRLDPVAVFCAAANAGFLSGNGIEPGNTSCDIVKSAADPENRALRWTVATKSVPSASFRVLLNTLIARKFETIQLRSDVVPASIGSGELSRLAYASPYSPCPFPVHRETPLKNSKDRCLRVFLAEPAPDELVDRVYRELGLWVWLMNLGGYPRPGDHPTKSGVLPDFAVLLDETTFQQAFPEAFFCDDAAFDAAVNWAMALHRQHRVQQVEIV